MACTYRFKDASGKEVVITGQAAMKAYLAEGGLKELMGSSSIDAQASSDFDNSRIENSVARVSLSAFSARDVRIQRKIARAPNPAERARLQGFYDFMLGNENASKSQGKRLEVSYQQGWDRGSRLRSTILKGRPWYEVDKSRDGGKWDWTLYREGFYEASGASGNEKLADQAIEDAKADIADKELSRQAGKIGAIAEGGLQELLGDGSASASMDNLGQHGDVTTTDDGASVLRDSAAEPEESGPTREQAEDFIRRFVAEYPAAPEIILSESFHQLPKEIQSDAFEKGSGPNRVKGAVKRGKAYIVLDNHSSMADLEATMLHEAIGHVGLRKLFGDQFAQELNRLFIGLGGRSGLRRIMDRRGLGDEYESNIQSIEAARDANPGRWTDDLARMVITEEVMAHIAEQQSSLSLKDRFAAVVGMVRDWLRRHGFRALSSLNEADLVFVLSKARAGLKGGEGVVRGGVTVGANVIVDAGGRTLAVEGSPEFESMKVLADLLGLRETSGPTVFSDSLRDSGRPGDDARMDDANNVAGKQAPTTAGDVEAGGERYTSRNWKEWADLPRFQSDDESTVLFNHGHGGYIKEVESRSSGVFDGLFALYAPGMTERGPDVTAFRIPNEKMLSQHDLEYELDYGTVSAALLDVFPKSLDPESDRFESAWQAIVEDRSDFESLGLEDDGTVRDDSFMDILGYDADEAGEASWFAQKLRGRLAAKLGYQAVEMNDENGTSWYIVPGVKSIPLNEPSASQKFDVRDAARQILEQLRDNGLDGSVEHWGNKAGLTSYISVTDPRTGARFPSTIRVSDHSVGSFRLGEHQHVRSPEDVGAAVQAYVTAASNFISERQSRKSHSSAERDRLGISDDAQKNIQILDQLASKRWEGEWIGYSEATRQAKRREIARALGLTDDYLPPNEPSASASPDAPSVFRTEVVGPRSVRTRLAEFFDSLNGESAKTFNWWQRTIGSQYGKAKSDRDFGRVYDAAHAFLDGVADFAKSASALAPNILPHLDTLRDVAKGAKVKRQWSDSKDYQAISSAIFEGTLSNGTTGQVWSDQELRDRFGLNDRQISLYREFRQSVDFSLETLAASEMARLARAAKLEVAGRDVGMDEALAFYMKQLDPILKEARAAVEGKAAEFVARHAEERAVLADASINLTDSQTKLLRDEMDRRHKRELEELMAVERDAEALRDSFVGSVEQIRRLEDQGYAPLMRFGQYTVDVVRLDEEGKPAKDEDGAADRPFFGMFETEAEAKRAAKILSEEYPGYAVTQGVLSVDSSQLYRGLTPETAELFARLLGTDEAGAFQAYLQQAVANRSATKRLINRIGIEGFSNDVPRVLAAFITSNARLASGNWHFGEMNKAAEAIPKHKGDVKDEAIRLMQYVQNPQEEAAGLRGFLFFSFLGGSIASAITNLTQTFSTTLPYLHQFAGPAVAKVLPKAMALSGKMMTKGLDAVPPGELRDALKKASDEGVVDPQEIHLLMAESGGNGASIGLSGLAGAINKEWATPAARVTRSLTQAWGMFFGAAEKYNRHVAFIAAWEVAPDGVDRYEFAKNAVTETQFDYTKASRPNWARGAVGATLFTFKTFAVNYVEFMSRLPPRERAVALGVLFLMAGLSGMPGADDLDDVVDTVAQKMGYNWNNSAARHAWLVKTLTAGGADFVERGLSSLLPLDVSARLGMGNLVPGSGVLMKSNDKPARDIQEFFGPIGSVFASGKDVFDNVGTGKGAFEMVKPLAPKSMGDIAQAIDMIQTGQYRDRAGRKVVDVDALDAAIKAIGFQPNVVAGPRRVERMLAQSAAMHRAVRQDIHTLMARGRYEGDADKVEAAREMMRSWNEKNPETPIRLNPTSVAQRVRAMRQTSAERLVKATPKDMRGALSAELAVSQ